MKGLIKAAVEACLNAGELLKSDNKRVKLPRTLLMPKRRIKNHFGRSVIYCELCSGSPAKNVDGVPEKLLTCSACGNSGHPSCLRYLPDLGERLLDSAVKWFCATCKICGECNEKCKDPAISCDGCDRGFHISCLPNDNGPPDIDKDDVWLCSSCIVNKNSPRKRKSGLSVQTAANSVRKRYAQMKNRRNSSGSRRSSVRFAGTTRDSSSSEDESNPNRVRRVSRGFSKVGEIGGLTDSLTSFFTPNQTRRSRVSQAATVAALECQAMNEINIPGTSGSSDNQSSTVPATSVKKPTGKTDSVTEACETNELLPEMTEVNVSKSNLKRLVRVSVVDCPTIASPDIAVLPPKRRKLTVDRTNGTITPNQLMTPKKKLFNNSNVKLKEVPRRILRGRFPPGTRRKLTARRQKRLVLSPSPIWKPNSVSEPFYKFDPDDSIELNEEDVDTFAAIRKRIPRLPEIAIEEDDTTPRPPIIHFGDYAIKTWFRSNFPAEYALADEVVICEFCLSYMKNDRDIKKHFERCKVRVPPGNEIYRSANDGFSVFEVNGETSMTYCRCLCLLSQLFLESKTLWSDTQHFMFYVLVENRITGRHLVGYFSKEKKLDEDSEPYNLSCITTLPMYQKKGYGRFLIGFSYLMSRHEKTPGTPERPLSELGEKAYHSYWAMALKEALWRRSRSDDKTLTVYSLAKETGIAADDIATALNNVINDSARFVKKRTKSRTSRRYQFAVNESLVNSFTKSKIPISDEYLRWVPLVHEPSTPTSNATPMTPASIVPSNSNLNTPHSVHSVTDNSFELTVQSVLSNVSALKPEDLAFPTKSSLAIEKKVKKVRKKLKFHAPPVIDYGYESKMINNVITTTHQPNQSVPKREAEENSLGLEESGSDGDSPPDSSSNVIQEPKKTKNARNTPKSSDSLSVVGLDESASELSVESHSVCSPSLAAHNDQLSPAVQKQRSGKGSSRKSKSFATARPQRQRCKPVEIDDKFLNESDKSGDDEDGSTQGTELKSPGNNNIKGGRKMDKRESTKSKANLNGSKRAKNTEKKNARSPRLSQSSIRQYLKSVSRTEKELSSSQQPELEEDETNDPEVVQLLTDPSAVDNDFIAIVNDDTESSNLDKFDTFPFGQDSPPPEDPEHSKSQSETLLPPLVPNSPPLLQRIDVDDDNNSQLPDCSSDHHSHHHDHSHHHRMAPIKAGLSVAASSTDSSPPPVLSPNLSRPPSLEPLIDETNEVATLESDVSDLPSVVLSIGTPSFSIKPAALEENLAPAIRHDAPEVLEDEDGPGFIESNEPPPPLVQEDTAESQDSTSKDILSVLERVKNTAVCGVETTPSVKEPGSNQSLKSPTEMVDNISMNQPQITPPQPQPSSITVSSSTAKISPVRSSHPPPISTHYVESRTHSYQPMPCEQAAAPVVNLGPQSNHSPEFRSTSGTGGYSTPSGPPVTPKASPVYQPQNPNLVLPHQHPSPAQMQISPGTVHSGYGPSHSAYTAVMAPGPSTPAVTVTELQPVTQRQTSSKISSSSTKRSRSKQPHATAIASLPQSNMLPAPTPTYNNSAFNLTGAAGHLYGPSAAAPPGYSMPSAAGMVSSARHAVYSQEAYYANSGAAAFGYSMNPYMGGPPTAMTASPQQLYGAGHPAFGGYPPTGPPMQMVPPSAYFPANGFGPPDMAAAWTNGRPAGPHQPMSASPYAAAFNSYFQMGI